MSLSSLSIRRPVLASVFSIVIIIFGIIGFSSLGVREYPSVDPPVITVSTSYTGANADIIETQITEPIEEVVNGIAGIENITSTSREGRSTVRVEFDLDVDLEAAANDVRDKVSQAVRNLPPEADPPVVSKADADASPILFLNLKSDNRSLLELTEIADNILKERMQTIPGVSRVDIWGSKTYAMRLWLDPDKMAAYGITPLDVRNALIRENVELPSGRIEGDKMELTVRTMGQLTTPKEFNDLIIREEGDRTVRFMDIGKAELGPENMRTVLKRDNIPMVGIVLRPQPNSNHIEIVDEFYNRLEKVDRDIPADIEMGVGFDNTKYVRSSIDEVQQTIFIAFVLVVIIIFLFLRDWRTTIIPVIVIPIALIGSFFIMFISGFSINVLTLLGIVLAIGLVVDDAIVVLENIYKKIEEGKPPRQAGVEGAAEIFFAVIATTLSLVAVFMPVIFLQGVDGRLFREFGVVIAGAVIISSFVALTLTPMLSSKILKHREKHNWFYNKTEGFYQNLTGGYSNLLNGFMKMRWIAFIIVVLSGGLIFLVGAQLNRELAPLEDRSSIMLFVTGPEGATFEYMEAYLDDLYRDVAEVVPERQTIVTVVSPGFGASTAVNSGFIRVMLKPKKDRERSQQEISDALWGVVGQHSGARTFVVQQQTISSSFGGRDIEYVIQAQNLDKLKEVLPKIQEAANNHPVLTGVDVNLKFNKPEFLVEIDRDKARSMGVSVLDVAQTLQLALSGTRFGYFTMNGQQYQVIGQVERTDRNDPRDLRSLYVRTKSGEMVQLDNLVNTSEESTPPILYRYDRYASATIQASLTEGYSTQHGIDAMDDIAATHLDASFTTSLSGASKEYSKSSSNLLFAFTLALVLVFLVLAAQFESFLDPLIIMFTVPLAIAGAVIALWFFDHSLNIFSQIGIIMLVGLVTKNAILIVEFANQKKASGLDKMDAIKEAAVARFRPILMTSLSTVLGVLPIALALGEGAESRISMGIAIIGGLLFASLLTLFVIPAVYSFISSKTKAVSNVGELREKDELNPDTKTY